MGNYADEAYTEKYAGRRGSVPLRQLSLENSKNADDDAIAMAEIKTKESQGYGEILEGPSGSMSVACI